MTWGFHRMGAASIAHVAAAVADAIRIEEFSIPPSVRDPDTVAISGDRREVADTDDRLSWLSGFAKVRNHGVVGVAEVDPLKSVPIKIDLV